MKPARCLTIFLSLFFLGFQLFPWSKAEGADFYVDGSNGDDSRDGLSWAAAKKTVSAAVSAASATGEMDTIRVAAGTYVENLVVTEPEVLLGGYPVGGGDRDWEANPTILDGAHLDTVVMIQGNGFGTVVDGFTITNGYSVWGGGIAIWGLTFPGDTPETLIQNCTITGNEAEIGGGIYARTVTCRILNDRIIGNTARLEGSAGGGLATDQLSGGTYIVEGNLITNNRTEALLDPRGGGLYISDKGDTVTQNPPPQVFVRNNVIRGNEIGGVRLGCCASLHNNEISENVGDRVAIGPIVWTGIFPPVWRAEISNNTIADNSEYGLHVIFGFITTDIYRSIIWGNSGTFWASSQDYLIFAYTLAQDVLPGVGNVSADPLFVTGSGGNYYLSQVAAGQAADSPALDSGGITAVGAGVAFRSTRTDGIRDEGTADMGFHYPPSSFSLFRGTDPANLPPYVTDVQLPYTDTGARTDLSFPILFYRVDTDEAIILRPSGADVEIRYFADRFD